MTDHAMLVPYNLTLELDTHYRNTEKSPLSSDEVISIAEAFQTLPSEKKQRIAFEAFKKLTKSEMVERAHQINKLNKLLKCIQNNTK